MHEYLGAAMRPTCVRTVFFRVRATVDGQKPNVKATKQTWRVPVNGNPVEVSFDPATWAIVGTWKGEFSDISLIGGPITDSRKLAPEKQAELRKATQPGVTALHRVIAHLKYSLGWS